MLDVLMGEDIHNVAVVVTRYFGGTLLGTGGLVRAYTESAKQAIEKANLVTIQVGEEMLVTITYDKLSEFQYYCQKNHINVIELEYGENIICKIQAIPEEKEKILQETVKKQYNIQNIEVTKEVYMKK